MGFLVPLFLSVGSLITGAVSLLGGSTILAGLARFGLGLATKYALGALLAPKQQAQASQLDTTYGEDLARTVALGKVGTAGQLVYRNAYSSGNRRVQDVRILSHFRITGITRVRVEGEWKTLGGAENPDLGFRVQGIDAEIWVKLYTGRLDQVADPNLIEESNPPGRWTSDHRGAGIAYAIVTSILDREHLTQPWDAFFEIEGAPLYDWRLDDTAGGDGNHRWNNQDTWEFSENPMLMAYALERGIFNGTEMMVGKGASASRLPLANWSQAANICDELVGTGARYSAGLIAAAGSGITHDQNLQPLLEASASSWVEDAGGEYPIAGAAQSIVLTFTDDDIMVDEAFRYSTKRTKSELINTLAGTYLEPDNFYEQTPLAVRIDDLALSADGERLAVSVPYSAVNRSEVADRLADIAFKASRYQGNAEITIHPKFLADANAGRWIEWDSAEYGTVTFQILEKRLGPLGDKGARNITLTLQEVSDGIFDPTAYETAPPDAVVPGAGDYQSELENYHLDPIIIETATGSQRAAIRASWDVIEDVTISFVEFQYRPVDQPDAIMGETATSDQTVIQLVSGVISLSDYEVRYRLVSDPPRTIPWTDWVQVTTLDARLVGADFYPIDLDQLAQDVKDFQAWTGNAVRDVLEQLQAVSTNSAGNFLVGFSDKQELRRELRSTTDGAVALFTEEIITATGPGSALALKIEALEATVNDPVTGVVASSTAVSLLSTTVSAQAGTIAANASAIIALQTTIGDVSAGSTFRMGTDYTPAAGWSSRIGIEARVTSGSTFRSSGLYIEATASASRIVLDTDQFVIMAGGVVTALFDAGTAFIANARIRNLTAGNITASKLDAGQVLQNGTLITSLIAGNAITDWDNQAFFLSTGANGPSFVTRVTITVNNTGAIPPLVFARMNSVYTAGGGSSSATVNMRLVRTVGGVDTVLRSVTYNSNSGVYEPVFLDAAAPAGTFTYRIDTNHTPAGGAGITIDCSVTANWWKK
ncbi:phage tail protein [Mesorhizobium sp. BR-1-1-8]|uniref:phage tail protein n=1 Tax=Mesorhizobium sp. BR-1-1-8 TaxID=2876659 RepID=UPI001CCFAA37|nr:phage tail protein [Mesorhizobium sp. BR-1-1-8]MBZ9980392.1 phage tail protein [Mesorhizobium sp. BR-1-1-8]